MKFYKQLLRAICIASVGYLNSQTANQTNYKTDIKSFINNFDQNNEISVLIIDNDKSEYIGFKKELNIANEVNNSDRIFEIGSITKVFTNILLANSVHKGKSSLNESLQSNFSFPITNGNAITLTNLANHSAGFPPLPTNIYKQMELTPDNPYSNYTENDLKEYLKTKIEYTYKVGERSEYSNLGMGLLGYVLTKKVGKSYEQLVNDVIFKPLSMTQSSTKILNTTKLVKGLNENGAVTSNWDFTNALVGAGGIKSTIVDMEKFIHKNFENDPDYTLPLKETFKVNKMAKIGLGWQIIDNGKQQFYWHNGGTGGYRSCLVFHKETKKAVLVLTNISAFHKNADGVDNLCFSIFKKLMK